MTPAEFMHWIAYCQIIADEEREQMLKLKAARSNETAQAKRRGSR